jgi:DNA processing protein
MTGRQESWLVAALVPAMSDAIYARLRAAFASERALFAADPDRLAAIARVPLEAASAFFSPDALRIAHEAIAAANEHRWLIGGADERFPTLLRELAAPPRFLWGHGSIDDPETMRVGIVGSRATDARSRDAAYALAGDLAERGYTIVSGLARGVDTAAHEGALDAGGRTIAVLGSGLDVVYPEENAALADRIARQGAVLSPFPLDAQPLRAHFPQRNETIAGLSRGVVVVQAPVKSGALITADFALHANREVFAVPGPVGEARYAGSNRLLRDGARVCLDAGDVIEELESPEQAIAFWQKDAPRPARRRRRATRELTAAEAELLGAISSDPLHIDEIADLCGLAAPQLASTLLALELKGAVHALPGKLYSRRLA